jgi:hypothetical protein
MENLAKLVETIVINKLASLPIEKRAMNWLVSSASSTKGSLANC